MFSKKFMRIISVLLCLMVVGGCVSCKDAPISQVDKNIYDGNHILTAPETSDYIVQNGVSEYKLVIPSAEYSSAIMLSVEEFNNLFKKATGITLSLAYDNTVGEYGENSKYISLGNTSLVEQAGIEYDKAQLKTDGCRIITKGKTVFILGASDYGVLNGVYDFMQICFNYEFYFRDCIEIDTDVKNLKLRAFDVTDIPDIPIRSTPNGANAGEACDAPRITDFYAFGDSASVDAKNRILRYRFNNKYFGALLPIYSEFGTKNSESNTIHNCFNYITTSQVKQGWFSQSGNQICYSASSHTDHFDEENFKALASHCASKIENSLILFPREAYPQYNTVTLTQADSGGFCNCPTCLKWQEMDNGALSGGMIRLNNAVMKEVKKWMELPENEPYRRDDLKLLFFSYNSSEACPVVYDDATETYVPANEEVVMEEGTGVYFAPMSSFDYDTNYYSSSNDLGRERLKQWTTLSDYCWLWIYGTYYQAWMYFFDSYNFHSGDAYQDFAASNIQYIFDENIDYSTELVGFNSLKTYIESKLMWDASLDQEKLIKDFFKAMYKDTADVMYQLFMSYRIHYTYIATYGNKKLNSIENYEPSDFVKWINYIDQALEKTEKYKETDSNLYLLIKERIELESVAPLYWALNLYGSTRGTPPFSSQDRASFITRLTEIAARYPTLSYSGYTPMLDFVQGLS